jgi:hypothetical protein
MKINSKQEFSISPQLPGVPDLRVVLRELLLHPVRSFVSCWNWKAAILSCILRVPIYVATTFKFGWRAITVAGLVEAMFAACVAGVYAALTQAIRYAEPQSMVGAILLIALPGITLAFDALIHYVMQTPNLAMGILVSLVVSVLSSAFNWYSMRRGTLLMGPASHSFGRDLVALPVLIARFVAEPVIQLRRIMKTMCMNLF